ncbi:hypothetical protein JY651_01075 [Pyxidicoccus parkwayensis]|uniref:DUF4384 domain-containing protein n=1 Tax=Pyxidicoccus parkwayensis TaxID=2813578 RepID=A0ABX7NXK8_9BACT|nr:hypothetical protein [Pyxidicoccus parkwaysis]QSQ23609.1 hypothetical protein JY651_01075 [Pyxidicoccus parkwaysis]
MSSSPVPHFPGVPDLLLERYLCGELPPDEARHVEEAARAAPALALHLENRRAAKRAFEEARPFGPVRAKLEAQRTTPVRAEWAERAGWARLMSLVRERALWAWLTSLVHERALWAWHALSPRTGARWAIPALGLCAVLTLVAVRSLPSHDDTEDSVRVRGGLTARVLVKRGEAVFEQGPGVVLRPGDRVRIEVEDVEGGTLYVLALSDRGRATPVHGFGHTGGSVKMEPGRLVLPGSLELDAAPEREALAVVLVPREDGAPSSDEVLHWAEAAARSTDFPPRPPPLVGTRYAVRELPKELP